MRVLYIIQNLINNKCYIGQTNNFEKRIMEHKAPKCKTRSLVSAAISKYGKNNFSYLILGIFTDEAIDIMERFYISKNNTLVPNGYNRDTGGCKNKRHSQETIEKITKSNTGKKRSIETRNKIGLASKGRVPTEEHKKRMSEIGKSFDTSHLVAYRKGRPLTEEHKSKISMAQKGKSRPKRGPMSEETKKKIGLANKGIKNKKEN